MASVVTPAYAQMVEGPPGSSSGVFGGRRAINPNRNAQSLELNLDLSGGFDRDPNAFPIDPTTVGVINSSQWSAGQALMSTNYRAGHIRRSLDWRARGTVNYQGNTHEPLMGGGSSLNGIARFGRSNLNQLLLSTQASYEPGWVFGAMSPTLSAADDAPSLDVAPAMGIIEQRWLILSATSSYQHHWNGRHQTSTVVGTGRVRPVGDAGLNNEWQSASLSQSWSARSGFSLVGSYKYDRSLQADARSQAAPIEYQSATLGANIGKRFSSTRRLNFSLSGGATQLLSSSGSTAAGDALHPAISLSLELVPARNWTVSVSGSRLVTVLAGVSAAPMENDNVAVNVSGSISRRLRFTLSGSYMQGTTLTAAQTSSVTTGTGGNISMRYGVKRWLGAFATYSYYQHRLNGLQAAVGLPPVYDRQSARAGFTLWLPLYGTF